MAIASSASAIQLPNGTSTDSGNTPSLYALFNNGEAGLVQGAEALSNDAGDTHVSSITAASDLSSTNVPEIVADFSGEPFEGTNPNSTTYATTLETELGSEYAPTLAGLEGAAASYAAIPNLIGLASLDPTDYPNQLFSVDGDLSVTSAATVKATGSSAPAAAYTVTVSTTPTAAGGYVIPSAFTVTLPNKLAINAGIVSDEISVAPTDSETTAQLESDPPASKSIGTVTLKSPAAGLIGSDSNTATGKIFVIYTSSPLQPSLELWLADGDYDIGTMSGITYPLTATYGEATVSGTPEALPLSSVSLSFPAATSPSKALSCTDLSSATATATDDVAGFAAALGDTTDGYVADGNTPVTLSSTPTVVTDLCAPSVSKASVSGLKTEKPKFGATVTANGGKEFNGATITLPKGVSAKGLKSSDFKLSGAKVKSVKVKGQTVTVTFASATKKVTVSLTKGLKSVSKLKKAKSLTFKVSVAVDPGGASSPATVKAKA